MDQFKSLSQGALFYQRGSKFLKLSEGFALLLGEKKVVEFEGRELTLKPSIVLFSMTAIADARKLLKDLDIGDTFTKCGNYYIVLTKSISGNRKVARLYDEVGGNPCVMTMYDTDRVSVVGLIMKRPSIPKYPVVLNPIRPTTLFRVN